MDKEKLPIIIVTVICGLAVAGMVFALTLGGKQQASAYTPPPFDSAVQDGMPAVTESLGYCKVYQEGMDFTAWVCGNVILNRNAAEVFLTSEANNTVWLKLRILDETGSILGETGLIKPGEYVQSIEFDVVPQIGQKIKMKIMAYEPDSYYSAGAVTLNTIIGKGVD